MYEGNQEELLVIAGTKQEPPLSTRFYSTLSQYSVHSLSVSIGKKPCNSRNTKCSTFNPPEFQHPPHDLNVRT